MWNGRKPIEREGRGSVFGQSHGAVGAQGRNEVHDVALEAEGDVSVKGGMREEFSTIAGGAHGLEGMGVPAFVEGEGDGGGIGDMTRGIDGPERGAERTGGEGILEGGFLVSAATDQEQLRRGSAGEQRSEGGEVTTGTHQH